MAANEILKFSETNTGTNLLTQSEYVSDAQRPIGNQPGIARAKLVNKAMLQSSTVAAGVAEFVANNQATDVTDGLTPSGFAGLLQAALVSGLGVTAPQFDNDTTLATTAFVQRALGNSAGVVEYTASGNIAVSDAGKHIRCPISAPITLNLPDIALVPFGATYTILADSDPLVGAGTITLQASAGQNIIQSGLTPVSSRIVGASESIVLVKKTTTSWYAVGGDNYNKNSFSFNGILSPNGYAKIPIRTPTGNGLPIIIQWGTVATGGAPTFPVSVSLPIAYPTAIVSVATCIGTIPSSIDTVTFTTPSLSTINFYRKTLSGTSVTNGIFNFNYIAIGY